MIYKNWLFLNNIFEWSRKVRVSLNKHVQVYFTSEFPFMCQVAEWIQRYRISVSELVHWMMLFSLIWKSIFLLSYMNFKLVLLVLFNNKYTIHIEYILKRKWDLRWIMGLTSIVILTWVIHNVNLRIAKKHLK